MDERKAEKPGPNLKKIRKEYEGKNGWSRWVQPVRRGYIMVCCDCGLAHRMDFRTVEGRVQLRAQRAPRYTSAIRKRAAIAAGKKRKNDGR